MVTGDITEPDGDGLSPLAPVIKYIKYTTNEDNNDVKNYKEAISDNIGQSKADDHRKNTSKEFENLKEKDDNKDDSLARDVFSKHIITNNQSIIFGTEGPNISQKPSYVYPDQNDPEKYLNNDQEKLDKVLKTPVFYNDVLQLGTIV